MKQSPKFFRVLRYAGLLAIVVLGLVSIIGTGGGGGGGGSSSADDGTYYADKDGDGYGDPNDYMESASQPQGYVIDDTDCDDTDAAVYPGAAEVCGDGIDNNCNGEIDEGCAAWPSLAPDTGQTTCYDVSGATLNRCPSEGGALYGQDACYTINPPSFTKLDADGNDLSRGASSWAMVKDNVSGLIWEVKTDNGGIHDWTDTYDWHDAADVFIAQLNADRFGGYSDWRLPTKKELIYMLNYGAHNPAIDTFYFPNTMQWSCYWSSTPSTYQGFAWCVYCKNGETRTDNKESAFFVRAVRGGKTYHTFTDNGDGTVTADGTGLMWMKATADDKMYWADALAWCENLSLAGYDDWRLPTIKELESIVDDNTNGELGIDVSCFPDTRSSNYWSSTTRAEDPEYAWHVSFSGIKYGYSYKKAFVYYVRAVRGGQ